VLQVTARTGRLRSLENQEEVCVEALVSRGMSFGVAAHSLLPPCGLRAERERERMPQFSTSTVALGVVLCLCTVASASAQLWPAPKSAVLKGPSRPVQSTFFFTSLDLNANLQDAITRYNSLIKLSLTDDDGAVSTSSNALINASVIVTGHDNHLGPDTDYRYRFRSVVLWWWLVVVAVMVVESALLTSFVRRRLSYEVEIAPQANVVTIQAPSVYGAMYGMETFSQMVVKGECQYSYAYIQDTPMYPHRGVLVDSGRRFAPVPLLKEIMDAMVRNGEELERTLLWMVCTCKRVVRACCDSRRSWFVDNSRTAR